MKRFFICVFVFVSVFFVNAILINAGFGNTGLGNIGFGNAAYAQLKPRVTFPFSGCDTVTITVAGDLMQHAPQINSAKRLGEIENKGFDYSHTFKYVKELFRSSDITAVNMEFTLGDAPYMGYPLFRAPYDIADAAHENGVNLFFTANNHIADHGMQGLEKTLSYYEEKGYPYIGVCKDSVPYMPYIKVVKGVKVAFVNFTYSTNGNRVDKPFFVNRMDSVKVIGAVERAKSLGADIIIAVPHWGNEYEYRANNTQRRWAAMLLRHGADIIIGGHPHVPQDYEINYYPDNSLQNAVFYSLGNFVSNQNTPDLTRMAMIVSIRVVKERITGRVRMLEPRWSYLWCFKAGEFEQGFTVVPVDGVTDGVYKPYSGADEGRVKSAVDKMKRAKQNINIR